MLTNNALNRLRSRIPELVDHLKKLQGSGARSDLSHNPLSHADPDPRELFGDLAAFLELLLDLAGRVESLEEDRAAIESKLEITRAAEMDWRPAISIRTGVVLINGTGEKATLSRDLLDVFAARRVLDADDVDREGDEVVIRDGERVVARMPVSLLVVLEKVLASHPWISKSR
jgi:hypothetical protein